MCFTGQLDAVSSLMEIDAIVPNANTLVVANADAFKFRGVACLLMTTTSLAAVLGGIWMREEIHGTTQNAIILELRSIRSITQKDLIRTPKSHATAAVTAKDDGVSDQERAVSHCVLG